MKGLGLGKADMQIKDEPYILVQCYGYLAIPASQFSAVVDSLVVERKYKDGGYTVVTEGKRPEFTVCEALDLRAALTAHKLEKS
jgi:hypothetical protein